ncbi:MAG: helix-turn-helix domain-containing protein [Lachnospiraceae bacterium]|nr:helix-turn-helix domain-containing protein [Lachnospiraceae bacterium]
MQLYLNKNSLSVYKALASDTRLEILNRLAEAPSTTSALAKTLGLSKAIVSRHLNLLEEAKLIKLSRSHASTDNRKKIYTLQVDNINVTFPKKIYLPYKKKSYEVKLGYYSDFSVQPSCGMASKHNYIGKIDDPRAFVLNERVDASLLWFCDGYIEYKIPNIIENHQNPEALELSLEIASEFPGSANIWPSDITFSINHVPVGTWTSPGNYSDVRGVLTPAWWDDSHSQYGLLKHLRVTKIDTGIDGEKLSDVNISDLQLSKSPFITVRIGINKDAKNKGGITLFGEDYGNHARNIILTLFCSES